MKKIPILLAAICTLFVTSCADDAKSELVITEMITQMQTLPKILEKVTDKESAEQAAKDIDTLTKGLVKLAEDNKDVKTTKAKATELETRVFSAGTVMQSSIVTEIERINQLSPEAAEIIQMAIVNFSNEMQNAAK